MRDSLDIDNSDLPSFPGPFKWVRLSTIPASVLHYTFTASGKKISAVAISAVNYMTS